MSALVESRSERTAVLSRSHNMVTRSLEWISLPQQRRAKVTEGIEWIPPLRLRRDVVTTRFKWITEYRYAAESSRIMVENATE